MPFLRISFLYTDERILSTYLLYLSLCNWLIHLCISSLYIIVIPFDASPYLLHYTICLISILCVDSIIVAACICIHDLYRYITWVSLVILAATLSRLVMILTEHMRSVILILHSVFNCADSGVGPSWSLVMVVVAVETKIESHPNHSP